MALGRTCSICADPARRTAVNGALTAGSTVASTYRLYGDALGFSEAAAYRHARHAHAPAVALSVPLPEGEGPGDALRVLVAVQRSQLRALERADAAGNDRLAASAADRLRAITHEMVDIGGIDATTVAARLATIESLLSSIGRAARRRPQLAEDLAAGLRDVNDHDNADALAELAAFARTH